jgi:carnosine N-methyltransferase
MAYYDIPWDEVQWFIDAVELNEQWDNQFRSEEAMQHYMRDWSTDGQHERDVPYRHIIAELEKHFPERLSRKEGNVKVLVPGSGLGRLAHEISRLEGVEVTACEYSPQMRLAYRYLESLRMPESGVVYPYIDFWSHQPTTKELIHPTKFPDVSINSSAVLLVEGDFTKEFVNKTAHYDALVTFFFIDTAKNAMDYLNTISKVLKPDGVWINLGPLLYSEAWVEFSLEDLLTIAEAYGFEFLDVGDEWGPLTLENKKARGRQIGYLFNERSLRRNTYMAQLWAARKKK